MSKASQARETIFRTSELPPVPLFSAGRGLRQAQHFAGRRCSDCDWDSRKRNYHNIVGTPLQCIRCCEFLAMGYVAICRSFAYTLSETQVSWSVVWSCSDTSYGTVGIQVRAPYCFLLVTLLTRGDLSTSLRPKRG